MDFRENCIYNIKGEQTASITAAIDTRWKRKIEKLAEERPDECKILARNEDGSIFAHIPIKWVNISPPRKVEMSEERKAELAERLRKVRENAKAASED